MNHSCDLSHDPYRIRKPGTCEHDYRSEVRFLVSSGSCAKERPYGLARWLSASSSGRP